MLFCDACSQPIRRWARRVWLDDARALHRACWQSRELFRRYFYDQMAALQTLRRGSGLHASYEVVIVDEASRGLIVVWDFGWASRRSGDMRVITDPLHGGAQHCMHRFGNVSIAPIST
jgi:hypothetical protein